MTIITKYEIDKKAGVSTESAQLAKEWATKLGGPVSGGEYSARHNAQEAAAAKAEVLAAKTAAETAAAEALAWSQTPNGQTVANGKKSAMAYAEDAAGIAETSLALPNDTKLTGTAYTMAADKLFKATVCENASPLVVTINEGLYTQPGPDGKPAFGWAKFICGGQQVSFVPGLTEKVVPPLLGNFIFPYFENTGAVNPLARTHSISVPAGTNRKLVINMLAIFNSVDAGRNTALTVSNSSGLTKTVADTSTGRFSDAAGPVTAAQWTCTLPDSATPTVHDLDITLQGPNSYALWPVAVAGCASFSGATGSSSSSGALTASVALTPPEAKCLNIFGMGFRGADAAPLSLNIGTERRNGVAGTNRVQKDVAYLFGTEARDDTAARTYTATSPKSDRSAVLGIIARPVAGVGVTLIPTSPVLTGLGKTAELLFLSDGKTVYVDL